METNFQVRAKGNLGAPIQVTVVSEDYKSPKASGQKITIKLDNSTNRLIEFILTTDAIIISEMSCVGLKGGGSLLTFLALEMARERGIQRVIIDSAATTARGFYLRMAAGFDEQFDAPVVQALAQSTASAASAGRPNATAEFNQYAKNRHLFLPLIGSVDRMREGSYWYVRKYWLFLRTDAYDSGQCEEIHSEAVRKAGSYIFPEDLE